MASEPLYLRVPTETRAYLVAEAERQGRPLANLAAHILNQWVQHQQDQAAKPNT
jgi:predicted HicB family RNase H-like nuclease